MCWSLSRDLEEVDCTHSGTLHAPVGDVYRCAEAYARGQEMLTWDCMDYAADACLRRFFSPTGALLPTYQCADIALSDSGAPASPAQIEECVRAAFGETSPFSIMNFRD